MGILSYKKSIDSDRAKKNLQEAKAVISADGELLESFSSAVVFATAISDASFFIFDKYEKLMGRKFANISRIKSLLNQQSSGLDSIGSEKLSGKMGDVSDDIAEKMKEWAGDNWCRCLAGGLALLEAASSAMDAGLSILPKEIKCVTVSTKQLHELLIRARAQAKLAFIDAFDMNAAREKVAELIAPKK